MSGELATLPIDTDGRCPLCGMLLFPITQRGCPRCCKVRANYPAVFDWMVGVVETLRRPVSPPLAPPRPGAPAAPTPRLSTPGAPAGVHNEAPAPVMLPYAGYLAGEPPPPVPDTLPSRSGHTRRRK